jgi:dTDP-4-dehydrorhamnose reductase
MDIAAGTVIDISNATYSESEPTQVYHLANPHTTTWNDLYPVIQDFFNKDAGTNMEIVEYSDWVDELARMPQTKENAERVPGLKLLDFYQSLQLEGMGLPTLQTQRAEAVSSTLREGKAVDKGVVGKWLEQWAF